MKVIVDSRELKSGVGKELDRLGADIQIETLEVGDYVISDRVAVERKHIDDFFKSLFEDRKLFEQIGDLAQAYQRPVLIIEGGDPFFSGRQINPKALQGILNTIAISFRVPMLYTLNTKETAQVLCQMAVKEQHNEKRPIQMHGKRSHMTIEQQREYIVTSISEVGPVMAKRLLEHFGSVEEVMSASRDDLMNVELVGPKTADRIREIVSGKYQDQEK